MTHETPRRDPHASVCAAPSPSPSPSLSSTERASEEKLTEKLTEKSMDRVNVLGLTRTGLEAFFDQIGEKRFRAHQLMKWIHYQGLADFEAMTNLS
ncbi:MAG: hypothetical protein P8104_08335 [Gammaproteobacteria bacterium]